MKPVVCVFGALNVELHSMRPAPDFEETELECKCFLDDSDLFEIVAKYRPVTILSFGSSDDFPNLQKSPFEIRKVWIHYESTEDMQTVGRQAFGNFIENAVRYRNDIPLVSVFTPVYNIQEDIRRPYESLVEQTYKNWEWIVFNDSDDFETQGFLDKLASIDPRVKVFNAHKNFGRIGEVKRIACKLAEGEYFVELDHDDELLPWTLDLVVRAFKKHPECGFVYSDFAECYDDYSPACYTQNFDLKVPYTDWGLGYGSYRFEKYNGNDFAVVNAPNINAKTIRHIVAMPNHVRAWRKSAYWIAGGHSRTLHVADDYELMLRTFLTTRMCRVPHLCYIQYRNSSNTHRSRNKEIQRLVRYFSMYYDEAIHDRLVNLNVDDFIYKPGEITFNNLFGVENPPEESHCTVLFDIEE